MRSSYWGRRGLSHWSSVAVMAANGDQWRLIGGATPFSPVTPRRRRRRRRRRSRSAFAGAHEAAAFIGGGTPVNGATSARVVVGMAITGARPSFKQWPSHLRRQSLRLRLSPSFTLRPFASISGVCLATVVVTSAMKSAPLATEIASQFTQSFILPHILSRVYLPIFSQRKRFLPKRDYLQ